MLHPSSVQLLFQIGYCVQMSIYNRQWMTAPKPDRIDRLLLILAIERNAMNTYGTLGSFEGTLS